MSWTFRPSALDANYPIKSVQDLINDYHRDNARATNEGVALLPKPNNNNSNSRTFLRTLQWNVHGFVTADWETSPQIVNDFVKAILRADADVIVLNEYVFDRNNPEEIHRRIHQLPNVRAVLQTYGYTTTQLSSVTTPTIVASRWNAVGKFEVKLGWDRSVIGLVVEAPGNGARVCVGGTHLDHQDAFNRYHQGKKLVQTLRQAQSEFPGPMILTGDFNQQRLRDYLPFERSLIDASKIARKENYDDVAEMLEQEGFVCAWNVLGSDGTFQTTHNWVEPAGMDDPRYSVPPATHWSGTIVDYSYGKNVRPLQVSIDPVGLSDHRMTVCDWEIPSTTAIAAAAVDVAATATAAV